MTSNDRLGWPQIGVRDVQVNIDLGQTSWRFGGLMVGLHLRLWGTLPNIHCLRKPIDVRQLRDALARTMGWAESGAWRRVGPAGNTRTLWFCSGSDRPSILSEHWISAITFNHNFKQNLNNKIFLK